MMRSLGKLLVVAAGFAVYYLAIGVIIGWMLRLIVIYVTDGSGAALLFSARTLLPLSVIVVLLVFFYREIKRSHAKRAGIASAKKDDSSAN